MDKTYKQHFTEAHERNLKRFGVDYTYNRGSVFSKLERILPPEPKLSKKERQRRIMGSIFPNRQKLDDKIELPETVEFLAGEVEEEAALVE